jgi:hypothetical protein
MLAFITSYWFVTLPSIFTGLYLLRILKIAQETAASRQEARATIVNRQK